jgi:hypothetical protein
VPVKHLKELACLSSAGLILPEPDMCHWCTKDHISVQWDATCCCSRSGLKHLTLMCQLRMGCGLTGMIYHMCSPGLYSYTQSITMLFSQLILSLYPAAQGPCILECSSGPAVK